MKKKLNKKVKIKKGKKRVVKLEKKVVKKIKKAKKIKARKIKKGKKSGAKKPVKIKSPRPWGIITHYYGKIGVAIVKLNSDITLGANVSIIGATTNFKQSIDSMQADHEGISIAKKGQEIGIKVKDRVREGDELFGTNS